MIIFPMCGESSRFFSAGYTLPKYQLPLWNETVFYHVINGFKYHVPTERFLFIIRKNYYSTRDFVNREIKKIFPGFNNYEIVELDEKTDGQASTVYLGLSKLKVSIDSKKEKIIIFNVDTIRKNLIIPRFCFDSHIHGFIETVNIPGENWSFVKPKFFSSDEVLYTTEKRKISNFCCTGLYGFKNFEIYSELYSQLSSHTVNKEKYISYLYNIMNDNYIWKFYSINKEDFIPCGVPSEYNGLI